MTHTLVESKATRTAILSLIVGSLLQNSAIAAPQKRNKLKRISATTVVASNTTKSGKITKKPGSGSPVSSKPAGLPSSGNDTDVPTQGRSRAKAESRAKSNTGKSSTTSTATLPMSWKERLSVGVSSSIAGPTLNSLSDTDSIEAQNTLSLGYKLNRGWSTAAAFNFGYRPGATESLSLLDPYAAISNYTLIEKNGYAFGGFLRLYAPVSSAAQGANLLTRARLGIVNDFTMPNSRWNLSLYTYAQGYVYGDPRSIGAKRLVLFAEPSISYQVNPKLTATLLYDMDTTSRYDAPLMSFSGANTGLYPGLTWSPTRWLKVEPSVGISTGSRVALDTTTANLALSAKLR